MPHNEWIDIDFKNSSMKRRALKNGSPTS